MNIWYLMRFGRKHDKENVIWLVRFFDAWCDESELTIRLKKHISNLKDGNYDAAAAIDMGNTFLSCENIPDTLKEELIKTTNSILPDKLLQKAKKINKDVLAKIEKLIKEEHIDEATALLETVNDKSIDYYMLAISVYLKQNNKDKIIEATEAAWKLDNQNSSAAITMGLIYETYLNEVDNAIQFYKTSLDLPQPHPYAACRLGDIYKKRNDYENAIKYYKQAVSKNFKQALLSLGSTYTKIEDFEKAEKTFKDAIAAKVEGSNSALAKFLVRQHRSKEAVLVLQNAVELNEEDSYINLGRYYLMQKKPNLKKAEEQFILAIEKGETDAYNQLARLYIKQQKTEKAIKIFEQGVAHNNPESAHQLGHIHNRRGNFEESDAMYAKAIELGDDSVAGCWVESIYNSNRVDKRNFAIKLLENQKPESKNIHFDLLYAKIQLWSDNLSQAIDIIKKQTNSIRDLYNSDEAEEKYAQKVFSELVDFFLLLIAKREYKTALDIFSDSNEFDYRTMLKPVYYLLMEELKEKFPMEYLKAGKELTETINDLKKEIEYMRKK